MSIVVTKCSPEVVGPCEAGRLTGNIRLSSFDKCLGSVPVPLLLVFDKPIHNPVDSIRRALSRALVHYYPVSGRLAVGADGSEVITCTGRSEGVLFVGASASCAVGDVVLSSSPPALLKDLFLRYPKVMCHHADPLLLMQVTEFSCGGFAIGVTWNHVLADGAGMGQFLQALGELARGMSLPSVVPVRSDESFHDHGHGRVAAAMDYSSAVVTEGMAFLDCTIPSSFISRVRNALGKSSCTTVFEVVVALLWQCRARAVISDDDSSSSIPASSSIVFGYNMRGLVGAAGGYYGNCLIQLPVVATSAEVANGDLMDVVRLIQVAKKKIQDNKVINNNGDVLQLGYNTLLVSSWRNLGLESPDFGGGRPARVIWYQPRHVFPFFVVCPPCQGNLHHHGVNVLGYIVKKEHVDAFTHHMSATCGQQVVR